MAPHAAAGEEGTVALEDGAEATAPPPPPPMSARPPRLLVIGAGSRGRTYARCAAQSSNGVVVAVAEPDPFKRAQFCRKFIRRSSASEGGGGGGGHEDEDEDEDEEGTSFADWRDFVAWELDRRRRVREEEEEEASSSSSSSAPTGTSIPEGVDAAFVCVRDELHHAVVMALAPLGLHIMCEKPLATTLADCVAMCRAAAAAQREHGAVFSIGHVLRYSPHNALLRELLLGRRGGGGGGVVGDILSVEHTEPVGFWHFAHSYVRGNWRRESATAPSLLTKSCHDIDLLLWLMCSSSSSSTDSDSFDPPPHLPARISSSGSLQQFRRARKPRLAGAATNCLSCPAEPDCIYSSRRIYLGANHQGLATGNTGWPVSIVVPDIESFGGSNKGDDEKEEEDSNNKRGNNNNNNNKQEQALMSALAEDYDASTAPAADVAARNWFGRCVYESDNDVCDEQTVVLTWDDDPLVPPPPPPPSSSSTTPTPTPTPTGHHHDDNPLGGRGAKQATFHMVAPTRKQCQRYTVVRGTRGEVHADSRTIAVDDFATGKVTTHHPKLDSLGHGGGDHGLTRQFVLAVDRVKNGGWTAAEAQRAEVGCSLDDVLRAHAACFAAEDARREGRTVEWARWWTENVGDIYEVGR